MLRKNFADRKKQRQEEATARQEVRNKRTDEEQVKRLYAHGPEFLSSSREISRLMEKNPSLKEGMLRKFHENL